MAQADIDIHPEAFSVLTLPVLPVTRRERLRHTLLLAAEALEGAVLAAASARAALRSAQANRKAAEAQAWGSGKIRGNTADEWRASADQILYHQDAEVEAAEQESLLREADLDVARTGFRFAQQQILTALGTEPDASESL